MKRFAKHVQYQYIEVDAETEDDAYELAAGASYEKWSEWEECSFDLEIDYDSIERIEEVRKVMEADSKYRVAIKSDTDNPENNGSVIYGPTSKQAATGFLDGVEYVNDSALTVELIVPESEET